MNRTEHMKTSQVYRLKPGDHVWIHDRYETVARHIGEVVKVTDTQVHIKMDYGMNGGARNIVYKFHRLDRSIRISSGWQLDSTKEKRIYGLATETEVREYKRAIDQAVREREQKTIARERRESNVRKINESLPNNMHATQDENGKWTVTMQNVTSSQVRSLQTIFESF